ncbi:DUF6705 family protein [Chryseobacterium nepalense]|uniref:DUF6705 domain-containing protein n=1 Tax=Chryseobacterium nepalense TaxID=1854498 RepID=A0ABY4K9X3_9FLAO|nr:DUF6705 family protein [Chryseobacterium nepalense]UPQ77539.1 hypothetical protein M0D58_08385 [Chryseobacterium nepalense]
MKSLLLLFILCISCSYPKAQEQILPLKTKGERMEGAYYKDLDHELDPFLRTWQGIFQGKTFIITFTKIKYYSSFSDYFQDSIIGKYKMLDSNGNLLYSTYNLTDNKVKILSIGFKDYKTKLWLSFTDKCIEGDILIHFTNYEKTQLYWKYITNQTIVTDDSQCAPFNEMPRGEYVMNKL